MNEATIQTILNYVIGFLSTGVGAAILGAVIKAIVAAIANVKTKKYSKLTEADKTDIVNEVTSGVLKAIQGGVSVDMDAQLDKATAKRITAEERSQNDIVEQTNRLMDYQRVVLSAIGDFKTISQTSKDRIQGILKQDAPSLDKVQTIEQPVLEVRETSPEETPKQEKFIY